MWHFKAKRPVITGKVIDMTRTCWGHNISIMKGPDDKGVWKAAIWNALGAAVGDEITWSSAQGVVRSRLTSVEHTGNVWDMYFIEGVITHLNDQEIN